MKKKHVKIARDSRFAMNRKTMIVFIAGFAGIGAALFVFTKAASQLSYTIDPTNGTPNSTATVVADGNAHGSDAVLFRGCSQGLTGTAPNCTTPPVSSGAWPANPTAIGANICGNASVLTGPATAPAGAITVPAGDNSGFNFFNSNTTYYFATGVHTLGTGQYGQISAKVGNTYIGAPGAIIDGQGINKYAFTDSTHTATNVTIKYLTIRNFGTPPVIDYYNNDGTPHWSGANNNEGVVNHDAVHNWTISNNTVTAVKGAAVFVGSNNTIRYNCLKDNGQYGFSAYEPAINGDAAIKNVVLEHNEISGNNTDDWETKNPGCGCTGGGKFWDVQGARISNNWVHDNLSVGLWADTNNIDFLFENNYIDHNDGEGIWYEISYNATIRYNYFGRNAWVKGNKNKGSPGPAIYLSESGGDSRLQSTTTGSATVDIHTNYFADNMAGIMAYENVNRYCDSRGNTSGGYCTPFVLPTNFPSLPAEPPYLSYPAPVNNVHPCYTQIGSNTQLQRDCRWRAQNITIHANEFHFTPANVPNCSAIQYCGVMALYADGADNQPWQLPFYSVANIRSAIANTQNNHWSNNAYFGSWKFMYGDKIVGNSTVWRSAPNNQDAGSTFQ